VAFATERRGRPSAYDRQYREGRRARASPESCRSRSPSRCRDSHRRSRSIARDRRERRRLESSESERSASPQAIPVLSGTGPRQSQYIPQG